MDTREATRKAMLAPKIPSRTLPYVADLKSRPPATPPVAVLKRDGYLGTGAVWIESRVYQIALLLGFDDVMAPVACRRALDEYGDAHPVTVQGFIGAHPEPFRQGETTVVNLDRMERIGFRKLDRISLQKGIVLTHLLGLGDRHHNNYLFRRDETGAYHTFHIDTETACVLKEGADFWGIDDLRRWLPPSILEEPLQQTVAQAVLDIDCEAYGAYLKGIRRWGKPYLTEAEVRGRVLLIERAQDIARTGTGASFQSFLEALDNASDNMWDPWIA